MEVNYCRENHKSFMTVSLKDSEQEITNRLNFGIHMITENNIRGILPVAIRLINGDNELFYDISSKQSLLTIFEKKLLYKQDLMKLFNGLYQTIDILESYFLNMEELLLLPEFIFFENGFNQIYLTYCPKESVHFIENTFSLSDFILEHICNDDEATVVYAYSFYRILKEEAGDIKLAMSKMKIFEEQECVNHQTDHQTEYQSVNCEENFYQDEILEDSIECDEETEINNFGFNKKNYLYSMLLFSVGFLVFCYGIYVYGYSFLYMYTKIEFIVGEGICGAAISYLVYSVVSDFIRRKNTIKPEESSLVKKRVSNERDNLFFEKDNFELNNIDRVDLNEDYEDEFIEYGDIRETKFTSNETVLISEKCYVEKRILEGKIRGKRKTIDLSSFPFVIGKSEEFADFVIEDATVSRSHARFTLRDDIVYITDLNSANGTKVNGMKLQPNETVPLESEDEIDFGRVSFIYY